MKNSPKTNYISWSRYSMFKSRPRDFIWHYVLGYDLGSSYAMDFGKDVADAMEVGMTNHSDPMIAHALTFFPKYPQRELELKEKFGGVTILGKLDGYDPATETIGEYKTGTTKWCKSMVDKHGQLTVYCLLHYLKHKKLPKSIKLHHYDTGSLDIKHFETSRTIPQILKMASDMKDSYGIMQKLFKLKNFYMLKLKREMTPEEEKKLSDILYLVSMEHLQYEEAHEQIKELIEKEFTL